MQTLQRLFHYNAWANRRVFEVTLKLEPALLAQDARGTLGSLEGTLKHMIGVEEVYLTLIEGRDLGASGSQEAFMAHDLAWFHSRAAELGAGYLAFLATADEPALERPLAVPWIPTPLTVRDGLLQVLMHSAQHRAQVFSTLGDRGHAVPYLDYVVMLAEGQK
jgi:uncharacterized damage-inducible protein DinB